MENKEKDNTLIAWERLLGKPENKPNTDFGGFDDPERADELEICEQNYLSHTDPTIRKTYCFANGIEGTSSGRSDPPVQRKLKT